jgi:hypothetical protein
MVYLSSLWFPRSSAPIAFRRSRAGTPLRRSSASNGTLERPTCIRALELGDESNLPEVEEENGGEEAEIA